MKKVSIVLLTILILILIILSFFLYFSQKELKELETTYSNLMNNPSNRDLKEKYEIKLDIKNDNIKRIGVSHSKHYEITDTKNMQDIISLINNLSFKRCAENKYEKLLPGFIYNIVVYTTYDDELLNIKILSENRIKIKNIEYEAINGKINIDKITQLINSL